MAGEDSLAEYAMKVILSIEAEIAMTEIAGTAEGAKYVVYKASDMKPTYATETTGALLAFKITDKKFVSIGSERVPTVEMIKVKLA